MSINHDGVPYMVPIQRESKPTKVISSMQLFSSVQLGEPISKVKEWSSCIDNGSSEHARMDARTRWLRNYHHEGKV